MQCKNTFAFGGQEVLVYVHSVDLLQVSVHSGAIRCFTPKAKQCKKTFGGVRLRSVV